MKRERTIIVNIARGNVVCEHAEVADSPRTRMRGLLGRQTLSTGEGMLIQPAPSIHTAFMRFPIDVVFLDRKLEVVKLVPNLPPWRIAVAPSAHSALELAAGEIAQRSVKVGDPLAAVDPGIDVDEGVDAVPAADMRETQEHNGRAHITGSGSHPSLPPTDVRKVLLASTDRRFRSVAAALLTRRDIEVSVTERLTAVDALASELGVDVMVLDADSSHAPAALQAASLQSLTNRIGVVLVSDLRNSQPTPLPVVGKWDSFDALVDAVRHAGASRNRLEPSSEQL